MIKMIIQLNSSNTIYKVNEEYVDGFNARIDKMKLTYTKYESIDEIPSSLIPNARHIEKIDKLTNLIKDTLGDLKSAVKPIDYLRFRGNWSYISKGLIYNAEAYNNEVEEAYDDLDIDISEGNTIYCEYIIDEEEDTTIYIVLCLDTGYVHIEKQQSGMMLPFMWNDIKCENTEEIISTINEYIESNVEYEDDEEYEEYEEYEE